MLVAAGGCTRKGSPVAPSPGESVEISSPVNGESVFGTVRVRVNVTSERTIDRVVLNIDGKTDSSLAGQSGATYVFNWAVPEGPDSTIHTLQAKAIESDSTVLTSPLVKVAAYMFAPTNLKLDSAGEASIALSWQNNSRFEKGFIIEQAIGDSAFGPVDSVGRGTTTAVLRGPFMTNTGYIFRVRAFSDSSLSRYTNSVAVNIRFAAPFGLHANSTDDSTIVLTWQDTSALTRRTEIDMGTDGAVFDSVKEVKANGGTGGIYAATIVYPFTLGRNYYFRVRAISEYNLSPYSSSADTTAAFLPPSELSFEDSLQTGIVIRWKKTGRFARQFRIDREIGTGGFKEIVIVDSSNRSYLDKNTDVSQICRYRVRAENGSYYSAYTAPLALQYKRDNDYKIYDMMSGHGGEVGNVAFTTDDKMVVSAGADRTVRIWSVAVSRLIRTINLRGTIFAAPPAMAVYGQYIAVCDTQNVINIYYLNSGALIKTLKTRDGNLVSGLAFSPDGNYLGAVNTATMTVWQVSDWSVVTELHDDLQYALSFSPDGRYVAAGSTLSGSICVYDISTGKRTSLLSPFGYYVQWAVSFSPDGQKIAFGGAYGSVFVYPALGGSAIHELKYGRAVRCVAYSPDGTLLAAGGFDGVIDIWRDGTLLNKIAENGQEIGMAFSHNGIYLATGDSDNNVRVYRSGGTWEEVK